MSRIAVSNGACLIALNQIKRIELLLNSYDEILIPPEVRDEVAYPLDGIRVRDLRTPEQLARFPIRVHRGEAAAIALALEIPGCDVVLDDFKARQLAQLMGIKVIGTIGLILRAKAEGRIDLIRPIVDELQAVRFRISDELLSDALRLAGET